jgi:hypothetical protein
MNNEFKEWLTGAFVLFLITFTVYSFNRFIFVTNYYNLLEWFAIVMFVIMVKTGIDSWNKEE